MSKGNEPAYPAEYIHPAANVPMKAAGMTKRELFAAMAMQSLVTSYAPESVATMAVRHADALLAELERSA